MGQPLMGIQKLSKSWSLWQTILMLQIKMERLQVQSLKMQKFKDISNLSTLLKVSNINKPGQTKFYIIFHIISNSTAICNVMKIDICIFQKSWKINQKNRGNLFLVYTLQFMTRFDKFQSNLSVFPK